MTHFDALLIKQAAAPVCLVDTGMWEDLLLAPDIRHDALLINWRADVDAAHAIDQRCNTLIKATMEHGASIEDAFEKGRDYVLGKSYKPPTLTETVDAICQAKFLRLHTDYSIRLFRASLKRKYANEDKELESKRLCKESLQVVASSSTSPHAAEAQRWLARLHMD
jgi:hypothetical protein